AEQRPEDKGDLIVRRHLLQLLGPDQELPDDGSVAPEAKQQSERAKGEQVGHPPRGVVDEHLVDRREAGIPDAELIAEAYSDRAQHEGQDAAHDSHGALLRAPESGLPARVRLISWRLLHADPVALIL